MEHTISRLEIVDPPNYAAGSFIVLLCAVAVSLALVLQRRSSDRVHLPWPGVALVIVFLFIGLAMLTSRATFSLSRETNTITLRKWYFGFPSSDITMSLNAVRKAAVETDRYGRRIVIVPKTGPVIPMGRFNGQAGHYDAADAINDFLGVATDQGSR